MTRRAWTFGAAALAVALCLPGGVAACYKESGLGGWLSVTHPASLSVMVATRDATVAGDLPDMPRGPVAGSGDLGALSTAYVTTQYLVLEAQRAPVTGPGYAVVFLATGVWIDLDRGSAVARFHVDPPARDATTLVLDDALLAALLAQRVTLPDALDRGLLAASGPKAQAATAHFAALVARFAATELGRDMTAMLTD